MTMLLLDLVNFAWNQDLKSLLISKHVNLQPNSMARHLLKSRRFIIIPKDVMWKSTITCILTPIKLVQEVVLQILFANRKVCKIDSFPFGEHNDMRTINLSA